MITPYMVSSPQWTGFAKIIEETGELNTAIGKIICNNGSTDYWGDRDLLVELEDESADTIASVLFMLEKNNLNIERVLERIKNKLDKYQYWYDTNQ